MILETIRDEVIRNEESFNLVKLSYGIHFDYSIPRSELEIETYIPGGGRKITGETFSHTVGIWAQDDVKQHSSVSHYFDPDDLSGSIVYVVNGEVMKWATKPDLMRGGISNMERFKWSRVGTSHLGLRPLGLYKLSKLIAPENAIVHKETELIGDREAYVIDAKRPFRETPYYARIWIDSERFMPLKIQHYGLTDPSSASAKPHSEVVGIRLHQLPNGGWFPVEGTRVSYRPKPRPHTMFSHIIVDVNSITIQRQDIPQSLFEINFPDGARIHNAILGTTVEQGKGDIPIAEKTVNDSVEEIGDSTAESDASPDSSQIPATIPPRADKHAQVATGDLSTPQPVEPPGERGYSFILMLAPIAVTAFSLMIITLIIRHNSKVAVRRQSK